MQHAARGLAIAMALLVLAAGCRSLTGRTAGETIDDTALVAKVKSKLAADTLRNLTRIDVDANHGVVHLVGNVDLPEDKARAEHIARTVDGVMRVVNNLQTRPEAIAEAKRAAAAASPATTGAGAPARAAGEVVQLDRGSGAVTLRLDDGTTVDLKVPPASVATVKVGDRIAVSVSTAP